MSFPISSLDTAIDSIYRGNPLHISLNTNSAIGDLQILPWHKNNIFFISKPRLTILSNYICNLRLCQIPKKYFVLSFIPLTKKNIFCIIWVQYRTDGDARITAGNCIDKIADRLGDSVPFGIVSFFFLCNFLFGGNIYESRKLERFCSWRVAK